MLPNTGPLCRYAPPATRGSMVILRISTWEVGPPAGSCWSRRAWRVTGAFGTCPCFHACRAGDMCILSVSGAELDPRPGVRRCCYLAAQGEDAHAHSHLDGQHGHQGDHHHIDGWLRTHHLREEPRPPERIDSGARTEQRRSVLHQCRPRSDRLNL